MVWSGAFGGLWSGSGRGGDIELVGARQLANIKPDRPMPLADTRMVGCGIPPSLPHRAK